MNKLDQLDKIEAILFKCYNVLSQVKFILSHDNLLSKNAGLKKLDHEECIICGNGPSIKDFRFDYATDMPVFVVNYFYKGNLDYRVNPSYYVMIDDIFFDDKNIIETIRIYNQNPKVKFLFKIEAALKLKENNVNLDHAYFMHAKLIQYGDVIETNLEHNTTACWNVVLACVQAALFMGYKKIYLIGCESNFFAVDFAHFYDNSMEDHSFKWGNTFRWCHMVFSHYRALDKYSKKMGVEIINITPSSYIDAFRHIPLDEFYRKFI